MLNVSAVSRKGGSTEWRK